MLIWRLRHSPHVISCLVEQLGEECFDLQLFDGKEMLVEESFEEIPPLLNRAEELRRGYRPPLRKEPTA